MTKPDAHGGDSAGSAGDDSQGEVVSRHEPDVDDEELSEGSVRGRDRGHARAGAHQQGRPEPELHSRSMAVNRGRASELDEILASDGLDLTPEQPPLVELQYGPRRAEFHTASYYEGPLPDPVMLARYGEVDASFPGRIMRMTESQIEAQVEVSQLTARAGAFAVRSGAIAAMVIAVSSVILFGVLALVGTPSALSAIALLPAALAGVAQLIAALRQD